MDQTLKDDANENKTTPSFIYEILARKYQKQIKPASGEIPQGIGKYTVISAEASTGKDLSALLLILKKRAFMQMERPLSVLLPKISEYLLVKYIVC